MRNVIYNKGRKIIRNIKMTKITESIKTINILLLKMVDESMDMRRREQEIKKVTISKNEKVHTKKIISNDIKSTQPYIG